MSVEGNAAKIKGLRELLESTVYQMDTITDAVDRAPVSDEVTTEATDPGPSSRGFQ